MKKIKSGLGADILNDISDYYHKPATQTNTEVAQSTEKTIERNFNDMVARTIARRTHTRAMETEITKQFLPEIGIISQLISTNVMSPQDMITVVLAADSTSEHIPPTIKSLLNEVIKKYVLDTYKIDILCDKVLDKCLFGSGSLPVLLLPPSTIKKITRNLSNKLSPESVIYIKQPFTAFGVFKKDTPTDNFFSAESAKLDIKNSLDINHLFELVDDIHYCAYNKVEAAVNESARRDLYLNSFSGEAEATAKEENLYKSVLMAMRNKESKSFQQTTILKRPSKKDIEDEQESAIVVELPSECVIPITANGNRDENLGYIVLYENGQPINLPKDVENYMQGIAQGSYGNSGAHVESTVAMGVALTNQGYGGNGDLASIRESFGAFIESKINENIKEGILGRNASVVLSDSIRLAMFSRALHSKRTTLVYVPDELMSYFSFYTDDYGVGRSLVDMSSVIAGMRAALNYADGLRAIKNTIGTTTLDISIDPKDPNPSEYVEDTLSGFIALNRPFIPSAGNLMDNLDAAHAASICVNVSGNAGYPESKTTINTSNPQHQMTDEETHNRFQKQHLLYFGITPEQIDTSIDIERAAQITTNNLMFYKRVRKITRVLTEMMTGHIRKVALYDGPTIKSLVACLESIDLKSEIKKTTKELIKLNESSEDDKGYIIIHEYIKTLEFVLPDPSGASSKSLAEGFDELSEHLDKVLDAIISTDIMDEASSAGLTEAVDMAKARIKAYHLRRYCLDNEFLDHVVKAFDMDEEGELDSDISELIARHTDGSNEVVMSIMAAMKEVRESVDIKMAKLNLEETPPEEESVDGAEESDDVIDSDNADDTEATVDDTDAVEDDTPTDDDVVDEPVEDDTESEDDEKSDPEDAEQDKLKGYLDADDDTADKEKDSAAPEDAENDKLNKYLDEK